ncbi:hypothetical protein [Pseudorhodoferax sp. Leaf274]|uniref:hypothetical protein n=1 Tax=Pseudorhodoferax sp. Leaf274 TaxID=1736318 RepID=UPI0012E27971|nr:hypothetical protein [Pseudorhodoferax sp. Leaf274]
MIPTDRFLADVTFPSPVSAPAVEHAMRLLDPREGEAPRNSSPAPWMDRTNQKTGKEWTMANISVLLRVQQQQQQQPNSPVPSPALSPQPGHVDRPQNPLPGNPPVMPQPTPPETAPHPGF